MNAKIKNGMPNQNQIDLPAIAPRKIGYKSPPVDGRAIGQINRITRDLKLGIVEAAAAYGSDGAGTGGLTGYLFMLAGSHPKVFAGLLGKLLPLQVNSNANLLVGEVKVISVPVDHYLTQEDVRKMSPAPTIDHAPADPVPGPDESEPDQV